MAGHGAEAGGAWPMVVVIDPLIAWVLAGAALSLLPGTRGLATRIGGIFEAPTTGLEIARLALLGVIGLVCAMSLAAGTHNPFIYFRF